MVTSFRYCVDRGDVIQVLCRSWRCHSGIVSIVVTSFRYCVDRHCNVVSGKLILSASELAVCMQGSASDCGLVSLLCVGLGQ